MVDCNWYLSGSRLRDGFKRWRVRLAARPAVQRFAVWASHEVDDYHEAFGLAREKFVYVPFHGTLTDYEYDVRDDGYLFAGGNHDRDYPLIEAVRPLAVQPGSPRHGRNNWAHRTPAAGASRGTTVAGFRQAMAAARLVVVPMQPGLLHSGGQQTCLNAMLLGKPTIAVGRKWAIDFITDGDNGLVVDYADAEGLRRAVRWIVENPDAARRMGERGRVHAAQFTTQRTMQTVYELVKEANGRRTQQRVVRPRRWCQHLPLAA